MGLISLVFVCVCVVTTTADQSLQAANTLSCSEEADDTCPPAMFCEDGRCQCGKKYPSNYIRCNGTTSFALKCFCVSYVEHRNITLTGSCLRQLNNTDPAERFVGDTMYYKLPESKYKLDSTVCNYVNRMGPLCGQCLPDHYPLAYSYNLTCVPCSSSKWNWFRYITAAYLPLTLFYIAILFFKINITSSRFFAVVYCCQNLSTAVALRVIFSTTANYNNASYLLAAKIIFSFHGIWNLDFFRLFYTNLCLRVSILPTIALDYAIAVYPLILIVISYTLIVLHDRNYRVVTIAWKPFRILFSLFRRNWNIRTSVIDAFGTFFFLSNFKFLSVSFDLLTYTHVYQLYPDHYNHTSVLYYAGDIEFFGKEHLPFAILAIIVFCTLVLLPVILLAIYPQRCFQKFLNLFPVRWYILHTYMDSFHGCYKNGTQPGTRDYRWFVSVFFFARVCQLVLFTLGNAVVFMFMNTVITMTLIALIALLQPFKSSLAYSNEINIVFLLIYTFFCTACNGYVVATETAPQGVEFFLLSGISLALVPLLYFLINIPYWLYKHRKFGSNIIHRLRSRKKGYDQLPEQLPHRIENSGEYHRGNLANFAKQ